MWGQVCGELCGGVAFLRENQVSAVDEAGVGIGIVEHMLEIADHLEAANREVGIGEDRIVGTNVRARLAGSSTRQLPSFEQKRPLCSEVREVEKRRRSDDASA